MTAMAMVKLTALILATCMVGEAGWTIMPGEHPAQEAELSAETDSFEAVNVYTVTPEEHTDAANVDDTGDEWTYLGYVQVTGYTWTGNTCANGRYPTSGYTVACNDLPIGAVVYIEGIGYRTVEDRGGMTPGTYWMDVYFDSVSECYAVTGRYEAWIVSR